MSTDAWVVDVTFTAANGNVKQLYPQFVSAGIAKASATIGQLVRSPAAGALHSLQIKPDGTNAGVIEFYDVNGADAGADVSSTDVITDAQLDGLVARGKAKLLFTQEFVGTVGNGIVNAPGIYRTFTHGLAARFVAAAGACTLNLVCNGGYFKYESRGN